MVGSRIVGEEVVLLVWVVTGIKSISEMWHFRDTMSWRLSPGGWDIGWPEGE